MRLKVVTMVDQETDRMSHLQVSCVRHGLDLDTLQFDHWINNAFKLRFLIDYLNTTPLNDEDLLMVVDAYDVVMTQSADQLIARFATFDSDIVFSAEANYYFREPDLTLLYWIYYPRNQDAVFHFLNSGSFIGKVKSLKALYAAIGDLYRIDFRNDHQLKRIRSDQYVYSRFYVDYFTGVIRPDFTLKLDSYQMLFGCSGGRMAVVNWPRIHWIQDYLFFKYERRWLKTFWMKGGQTASRDFSFEQETGTYHNSHTKSSPAILHLPGTHRVFKKALKRISGKLIFDKWLVLFPITFLISLIAFVRSVFNFFYIKAYNRGVNNSETIFPVQAEKGIEKPKNIPSVGLIHLSLRDAHSLHVLSYLRGKRIFFIVKKPNPLGAFEKLGIEIDQDFVFLAGEEDSLNNALEGGDIIVDTVGQFLKRNGMVEKYLIIYPTGALKSILLGEPVKGAFPSDNPFTRLD